MEDSVVTPSSVRPSYRKNLDLCDRCEEEWREILRSFLHQPRVNLLPEFDKTAKIGTTA